MSLSIGERLKSAREAKNISLEGACSATKIQKRILQSIEQDRIQEELDYAYAKIFLKKYAAFLGLDGSAILEEYLALHGPAPEHPLALETEAAKASSSPLRGILIPAAVGSVALIGIFFLGYLVVDLSGSFMKGGAHSKADRPRRVAPAASSTAKRKAADSNSLTVEKTPSAPKLLIPRSQPLRLAIHTKADVWLQVKADGAVMFHNILVRGSQEVWTAKEELELWTGNAGAMELFLNGKPLEGLGSGVQKGIRITREGLKES